MIKSRIFVATKKKNLHFSRLGGWFPEERLVFRKAGTVSCLNNDPILSRCTNNHALMFIMYMFKCSDKLDALVNYLMQAWLIRSRCFISSMRCWMGLKHVGTKARVAWTLNQHNHANVGINASTSNQLRVSVIGCWLPLLDRRRYCSHCCRVMLARCVRNNGADVPDW